MFVNRKHKPESNAKRSASIKEMYANGTAPEGMGWPKYATDEERRRGRLSAQLKHRYGITMDDYDQMFEQQNGKCLICSREEKLVVDHSHKTGRVRGLLCNSCNKSVGFIEKTGVNNILTHIYENIIPYDGERL